MYLVSVTGNGRYIVEILLIATRKARTRLNLLPYVLYDITKDICELNTVETKEI